MSRRAVEALTKRFVESARSTGKEVPTRVAEKLARDTMRDTERRYAKNPVFAKYRDGER